MSDFLGLFGFPGPQRFQYGQTQSALPPTYSKERSAQIATPILTPKAPSNYPSLFQESSSQFGSTIPISASNYYGLGPQIGQSIRRNVPPYSRFGETKQTKVLSQIVDAFNPEENYPIRERIAHVTEDIIPILYEIEEELNIPVSEEILKLIEILESPQFSLNSDKLSDILFTLLGESNFIITKMLEHIHNKNQAYKRLERLCGKRLENYK